MANYYTQFSFIIPELTDDERAWIAALQIEQERYDTVDHFIEDPFAEDEDEA